MSLRGIFSALMKCNQIVARSLGIGQGVKILVRLHARERRAHHVAREVATAAHGDDTGVERLLHERADRVRIQVVQLDGLAGGEVRALYVIVADRVRDKRELFRVTRPPGMRRRSMLALPPFWA